jgi:hypothetical protein
VISKHFLDVYHLLGQDPQDSVRLLVIEVAASLAASFRSHQMDDKNLELVKPVVLGMVPLHEIFEILTFFFTNSEILTFAHLRF